MQRRQFLALSGITMAAPAFAQPKPRLRLSLAEWSLNKAIRTRAITNLDFPKVAREQFGIEGLEFVNHLMETPTLSYQQQLKKRMNVIRVTP